MRIENAYLCENCQQVAETDGHGCCGVCGSPALLSLAKVLNRSTDNEILNFAPRVSARMEGETVFFCAGGSLDKHAA
ncbi:MAG TPA: hypothetical protein VNJ12_03830 [Candidatus Dormibacteraeota bacterium]|nr:hypothetical protein [Candidatus Dormibacteraeota bacterium]